jgi:hypothetical protein
VSAKPKSTTNKARLARPQDLKFWGDVAQAVPEVCLLKKFVYSLYSLKISPLVLLNSEQSRRQHV